MKLTRFACGLLCLIVFQTVSLHAQGVMWKTVATVMDNTFHTTTMYRPGMFKNVYGEVQDEVMIVRVDRKVIYTLNQKERTYAEMTFAEFEAELQRMTSTMDEQMAEMREQLKAMPEEQRRTMQQMMGDKLPEMSDEGPVVVTKTGETKKLLGYTAVKYQIKQGEKQVATIWASTDVKEFAGMKGDFAEFTHRMTSINTMARGLAEAMRKVEGFPLETVFSNGMTSNVTSVKRTEVPASEFEIPAGYQKVPPRIFRGPDDMED